MLFLLLHLSLSFSCCEVLSCVKQWCFDSGKGGFPQGYCSFFHLDNYHCTGNHSRAAWLLRECPLHIYVCLQVQQNSRNRGAEKQNNTEMDLLHCSRMWHCLASVTDAVRPVPVDTCVKGGAGLFGSIESRRCGHCLLRYSLLSLGTGARRQLLSPQFTLTWLKMSVSPF